MSSSFLLPPLLSPALVNKSPFPESLSSPNIELANINEEMRSYGTTSGLLALCATRSEKAEEGESKMKNAVKAAAEQSYV